MQKIRERKKTVIRTMLFVWIFCLAGILAGAEETIVEIEKEMQTETEVKTETEIQTEIEIPEQNTGGNMGISDFLSGEINKNEILNQTEITNKLNRPEILKVYAKSKKSVKLTWKKTVNAHGYVIYRKSGSGDWKKIKVLKNEMKVSCTDKTVKSGRTYFYKIRAYRTGKKGIVYSRFSKALKIKTQNPTVKGNYKKGTVYGPSSTKKELRQVRRVAQAFKDNYIRPGMSDWQKAKAIFQYVRRTCDYTWENWTPRRAGSAWGALVEGKAHCGGYSRAVKVLCDAVGLKCYYVHANSESFNPTHRWNLVKIDGVWYVLDTKDGVFLAGTNTFCDQLGMTWDKKKFPICSKTNHSKMYITTSESAARSAEKE